MKLNIEEKGKLKPIILEIYNLNSYGLQQKIQKDGTSHFYFPIIFNEDHEDWIQFFKEITYFLRKHSNTEEVKKQIGKIVGGTTLKKFKPLRENEKK